MNTTKEVKLGRRYTCKVRGRDSVCRVKEIDKSGLARHSTVRIVCIEEGTGRKVVFRSPSRLVAELGEQIPSFGPGPRGTR